MKFKISSFLARLRHIPSLIIIIKYLLLIAIVYYVTRKIIVNWQFISNYAWSFNPLLFALSIFFHQIALLIYAKMWCTVIESLGHNIPVKQGFRISNLANLGRYIPGKIWSALGLIHMLRDFGVSKETAFASWLITTLFILPPAFLIGFLSIFFFPQMVTRIAGLYSFIILAFIIMLIISTFILIFPTRAIWFYNRFIGIFGLPKVKLQISKKQGIFIFSGYLLGWIFYGLAFYIAIHSVMLDPKLPLLAGIGSFVLAYILGYLAVFSPGGLGVREAVLITILMPYFGSLTAGIVGFARVWNICGELVSALIALTIKKQIRNN